MKCILKSSISKPCSLCTKGGVYFPIPLWAHQSVELKNDCTLNTKTMACSISGGSTYFFFFFWENPPPKKTTNRNWGNVWESIFHVSIWIMLYIIRMIDLGHHHGAFKSDIFQPSQSNVVSLFIINVPWDTNTPDLF